MAETISLPALPRKEQGSSAARKLRKQGRVPAVLYGHKEATVAITVGAEELGSALRHGARAVAVQLDGKTEQALIQEVQYDYLGKEMLHADFKRVSADERVVVPVRIELRGHAPGVTAGGVLDQPIHNLSVECLALAVPDSIRVSVAELQIGSVVHVKDLTLPEGVKAMVDPEAVVVQVKEPEAEVEAAAPGEAATGTEPEVITARRAEEGAEEEKK